MTNNVEIPLNYGKRLDVVMSSAWTIFKSQFIRKRHNILTEVPFQQTVQMSNKIKIFIYLILSILFLSNISLPQDKESKVNSYLSKTIKIKPKRGKAKLKFEIYRIQDEYSKEKKDYDKISEIKIYNSKGRLLQKLTEKDFEYAVDFTFDDYNFDGYKDIYLKDGCAILDNCSGNVFLYNPETGKYKLEDEFKDLTSIRISKTAVK